MNLFQSLFVMLYRAVITILLTAGSLTAGVFTDQVYRPFMIIDCGRGGEVTQKKCFRAINYSSERILYSGQFTGLRSFSHSSFIAPAAFRKGPLPVSFSRYRPYKYRRFYRSVMKNYTSIFRPLVSENRRYSVLMVRGGRPALNHLLYKQIRVTLKRRSVAHYFYHERKFKPLYSRYFLESVNYTINFKEKKRPAEKLAALVCIEQSLRKIPAVYSVEGVGLWQRILNALKSTAALTRSPASFETVLPIWQVLPGVIDTYRLAADSSVLLTVYLKQNHNHDKKQIGESIAICLEQGSG